MKELFAMANSNTLLALAYIRELKNPLSVICNLIHYHRFPLYKLQKLYDRRQRPNQDVYSN